jgi:protoporphyrin/coproporphyrin ferrochelatase
MSADARGRRVGVLVMAHGTPATPDEIEPFYTRIRRGRPPTPEQLADLVERYRAIGGTSPLAARTARQVAGMAARLEAAAPGAFAVRYGAKHTEPSIEGAAADLLADGAERVVGIVLTPHRSSMGSEEYLDRAAAGLGEAALGAGVAAPAFEAVSSWYRAPGFAELLAERVVAALDRLPPGGGRRGRTVLFTAHSLPERVLAAGDPYPDQVAESATMVAEAADLLGAGVSWKVAWQSAGRTPEPWIGPDLLAVVRSLPAGGTGGVVVCPIGFVADHLEVLYDVDVEAHRVADEVGVAFERTASLNDDPAFLDILASVVETAAGVLTGGPGSG